MDDFDPTSNSPATPQEEQGDLARATYSNLRWLMVLLPGVLLVVTVAFALHRGELESSISAYYGGPVRDVFVGVMIATAVCMVVYQGASPLEDYTLNGAGFYAVFVALVPSELQQILDDLEADRTPDDVGINDYLWVLRWSLLIVVLLGLALAAVEFKKRRRLATLWDSGPWNKGFVFITSLVLGAFLLGALYQLWQSDPRDVTKAWLTVGQMTLRIHDVAAILLIAALAVAVWTHAWPGAVATVTASPADNRVAPIYRAIFFLMLGGPLIAVAVHALDRDHTVILLEWWEIGLFSAFWALETRRVSRTSTGAR